MKFIMLVGLPGCGKSTFTKDTQFKDYIIHSPDKIRNELNLHKLKDTIEVFNILHNNIIEDMKLGKNIIYDSTNLTRKRRIQFLEMIKDFDYEKICYTFITPVNICKERNSTRTRHSKIKDYEYDIMLNGFNPPTSDEGWDKIIYEIQDVIMIL